MYFRRKLFYAPLTFRRAVHMNDQLQLRDSAAQASWLADTFAALTLAERLAASRAAIGGRMVFTTSFSLEDQAISHAILSQSLSIDIVTFDTGRLFPETHQVWAETERRYGCRIRALLPERRAALLRWSQHVAGLVSPQPDNVVAMQTRKRRT